MSDESLKQAWKDQGVELSQASIEAVRTQATGFQDVIRRRNRREYLAGVVVMLAFTYHAWSIEHPLTRLGAVLVVLGTVVLMWQLHKRGSSKPVPAAWGEPCARFLRQQLVRQRDALRSVWIWYLGPLVPGMAVYSWGTIVAATGPMPWIGALVTLLVFVGIGWLNLRGARGLQRKIDDLDRLMDGPERHVA